MSKRRLVARVAIVLVFLSAAGVLRQSPVQAASTAILWERWLAADPDSTAIVDHHAWDRLLRRHVVIGADGINRVAYGSVSGEDRKHLRTYIAALSKLRIGSYRRAEQFAYWVNLYNALTVDLVLDHYPVDSIRSIDVSPGLFADGPWRAALVEVEGVPLSLDDIEHRILRPVWREPRVHYALSCASVGCPNLAPVAYTATNTEDLLTAGARAYVNHWRGARVEGGKLMVSRLYRWFIEDFGGEVGVIDHVKRYAASDLAKSIGDLGHISDGGYDWPLNDAGFSKAEVPKP
jgi:hypothetical protein